MNFDKQMDTLIENIRTHITEEKELETLITKFNKIIAKKEAKAKKAQKASLANKTFYARTRVPGIAALQSTKNVTHESAIEELHKMTEIWK